MTDKDKCNLWNIKTLNTIVSWLKFLSRISISTMKTLQNGPVEDNIDVSLRLLHPMCTQLFTWHAHMCSGTIVMGRRHTAAFSN